MRNLRTSTTTRVSVGQNNTETTWPTLLRGISDDGTRVLFSSSAPNLVPGDTNNDADLFVRDTVTGTTTRVNLTSTGAEMPRRPCADGNDGNYCDAMPGALSGNGRFVAFVTDSPMTPNDYNDTGDVFVRDLVTGTVTRVSVASNGWEGCCNRANSDDGAYVAISRDGNRVLFTSELDNLVPNKPADADELYMHDVTTGQTTLVNTDGSGNMLPIHDGWWGAMSANGRYAAFASDDRPPGQPVVPKRLRPPRLYHGGRGRGQARRGARSPVVSAAGGCRPVHQRHVVVAQDLQDFRPPLHEQPLEPGVQGVVALLHAHRDVEGERQVAGLDGIGMTAIGTFCRATKYPPTGPHTIATSILPLATASTIALGGIVCRVERVEADDVVRRCPACDSSCTGGGFCSRRPAGARRSSASSGSDRRAT